MMMSEYFLYFSSNYFLIFVAYLYYYSEKAEIWKKIDQEFNSQNVPLPVSRQSEVEIWEYKKEN